MINGGPMMGMAQHTLDTPVVKNTSALLAFADGNETISENPTCIRCGKCMRACPMRLMPNYIYLYASQGNYEECRKRNVMDCIECGSCSYVCPAKRELALSIRMGKREIQKRRKARK